MIKTDEINKRYNQTQYVEDLLNNPLKFDLHKCYLSDLRLIALYLRDIKNYGRQEREQYLKNYCKRYSMHYNEVGWMSTIETALNYAKRSDSYQQKLNDFPPALLCKRHYDLIQQFELSDIHKKILFCVLCFYLYKNAKNPDYSDNYYIPNYLLNPPDIRKYTQVRLKSDETIGFLISDLIDLGYIEYSPKSGGQIIANFLRECDLPNCENDMSVEMFYPEKSYLYYDYFGGKQNAFFCKQCGDIFRQKVSKIGAKPKICPDCKNIPKYNSKIVFCAECGEAGIVPIKNNRSFWCPECRKKRLLLYDKKRKKNKFRLSNESN